MIVPINTPCSIYTWNQDIFEEQLSVKCVCLREMCVPAVSAVFIYIAPWTSGKYTTGDGRITGVIQDVMECFKHSSRSRIANYRNVPSKAASQTIWAQLLHTTINIGGYCKRFEDWMKWWDTTLLAIRDTICKSRKCPNWTQRQVTIKIWLELVYMHRFHLHVIISHYHVYSQCF